MRHNIFGKKSDETLATMGMVVGLVLIALYNFSPTIQLITIGLSVFFSCFIYSLIIKKKIYNDFNYNALRYNNQNYTSRSLQLFLECLFFIFFSLSLYIIHISNNRPTSYFVLISLCSGILAISIYINPSRLGTIIQILKIFILSLNIKYSIYFYGNGFPGVDSWVHAKMNDALSQIGSINVLVDKELDFPLMHIWTAMVKIITGTNIKEASNFAIIVPLVISTIFVFLAARNFIGENSGLIAMLIVNITDYHTYWGSNAETTTFGAILYYILLFFIVKSLLNVTMETTIISLIIMFTLVFTHAVSSFIFLITLIGLVIGSLLYKSIYKYKGDIPFTNLTLITTISLLMSWFLAKYKAEDTFFNKILSMLISCLNDAGLLNRPESKINYTPYLSPFIERLMDSMGFSILLFLAIIGCLFWLKSNYHKKFVYPSVTCIILLLSITFVFPLFGLRNIIPHRWFVFEYFFLSIMSADSIYRISILFNKSRTKKIIIFMFLFMLTFFMVSCTNSDSDSPIWLKNYTISTTYTFQEIKGAETLSKYSNNLVSDSRYGVGVLEIHCNNNNSSITNMDQILDSNNKIFVWRKYMLSRPIRSIEYIPGYYKSVSIPRILGYSYLLKLEQYNKLYTNGELSAYYIHNV